MFRWGIHKPPSAQPCLRSEPSILTLHHLASNMLFSCKAFSSLQGDDKQFCLLVFKPYENWFRIITSCYITLYIHIYHVVSCYIILCHVISPRHPRIQQVTSVNFSLDLPGAWLPRWLCCSLDSALPLVAGCKATGGLWTRLMYPPTSWIYDSFLLRWYKMMSHSE